MEGTESSSKSQNSPATLMYLEDDEVLASVISKGLTKRGFEVVHINSLVKAKPVAVKRPFDYALLDLKLGDGLSLELIPFLKQGNNSINILVLTGYASVATAVQAIKLGANNYLSKPVIIDDIVQALAANNALKDPDLLETNTMSVKRLEWEHIQQTLAQNNGNISATARQLKMHRRTLQRKLLKKPTSD